MLGFVTAAVVGVIANLLLFMLKTIYDVFCNREAADNPDYLPFIWILISVIAMKKFNVNMILWILISAVFGFLFYGL